MKRVSDSHIFSPRMEASILMVMDAAISWMNVLSLGVKSDSEDAWPLMSPPSSPPGLFLLPCLAKEDDGGGTRMARAEGQGWRVLLIDGRAGGAVV